ncbi:MAG: hypothetical protein ACKVZJ_12265 [Phycisphaerales bacterium]
MTNNSTEPPAPIDPQPRVEEVADTDTDADTPPIGAAPIEDSAAPPKPELKGIKIGPFIFVPEWSAVQGPDPWAHRKGEPRMLTLFWTIFLLAASAVTLFGTRGAGLVRAAQYQISARRLLLIVAFAAAVLWPMVRLCQQPPERSIGKSILLDALGLSAPVMAVLLPLPFLTGWSWGLLSMVWCVIAGWSLVTLSIAHLALCGVDRASGPRRSAGRALAMGAVLALVVGGAVLAVRHSAAVNAPFGMTAVAAAPMGSSVGARGTGEMWWAASPLSHVNKLTTAPSGLAPRVTEPDARAVVLLWVAGLGLALWASLAGRR